MKIHNITQQYSLADLPEFKKLVEANPGSEISEISAVHACSRAIHWLSILAILWPDFETREDYSIDVSYIVCHDPDDALLPQAFYEQVQQFIVAFWRIQLEELFPDNSWEIDVWDNDEMTLQVHFRGKSSFS